MKLPELVEISDNMKEVGAQVIMESINEGSKERANKVFTAMYKIAKAEELRKQDMKALESWDESWGYGFC